MIDFINDFCFNGSYMSVAENGSAIRRQEPFVTGDYVDRGSPNQLAAEALNGLGFNLQISREDLVVDGFIKQAGGVMIRGALNEITIWENLLSSPKTAAIRLAEGGWNIEENYLSEANFDPKTRMQILAYSLHCKAIRERKGAQVSYELNNSKFIRDIFEITADPAIREVELREERDNKIRETYQMTKKAREILGDLKPIGRSGLIAIFQQEAKTLYPDLFGNLK